MERVEVELDESTLARARALARERHCSLDRLISELIEQRTAPTNRSDCLLGMFADEPDLLDRVVESAMSARERDVLRRTSE